MSSTSLATSTSFKIRQRSLKNIMNKIGLNTKPWGTPMIICFYELENSMHLMQWMHLILQWTLHMAESWKLSKDLLIVPQMKNKNTPVSGNAVGEKNLHPGGRKSIFLFNLIEFFKQSLPSIVRREKTSFRPNVCASGKPP